MVATVDAVNGPATLDQHVESVRQVALADHILLTKLDLIDAAKMKAAEAALTARLHRLNPAAKISRIDDPAFNVGELLRAGGLNPAGAEADARAWLNAAAYEPAHDAHDHAHDHAMTTLTTPITITQITTIRSTTITACTTATSPRSVSSAIIRSRARRCGFCSTPCSRISAPTCCA